MSDLITLPCGLTGYNDFCCADNCNNPEVINRNCKDPFNDFEICYKKHKATNHDKDNYISHEEGEE